MNKKEAYQEKFDAQLREWSAKIDELKAKADQAKAEAKIEYYEQIEELRSKQAAAQTKLQELRHPENRHGRNSSRDWNMPGMILKPPWRTLCPSLSRDLPVLPPFLEVLQLNRDTVPTYIVLRKENQSCQLIIIPVELYYAVCLLPDAHCACHV